MKDPEGIRNRLLKNSERVGECLLWRGYRGPHGYGYLMMERKKVLVHRAMIESLSGPIEAGLTVDHLCHTRDCQGGPSCPHRACVEPTHLEVVTTRENLLRSNTPAYRHSIKTHCHVGHELTPENVYRNKKGHRYCRACRRPRNHRTPKWLLQKIAAGDVVDVRALGIRNPAPENAE